MANVEIPQQRMVLIEEFTGVGCSNCPKAHNLIYDATGIKAQHPGQVVVIAYHIKDKPQTEPLTDPKSKYDFRTQDATDVGTTIFGAISEMPSAGINRISQNNSYLFATTAWPNQVNTQAAQKPLANVYITSSYNAAMHSVIATVKIAYTQTVTTKQNLILAIIENNIIDAQEDYDFGNHSDYKHLSVLRNIITQFYGEPVLDNIAVKEAGRVYERTFSFNVDPSWNADNCQLVAFVHNNDGANKEVLQAAEVDIK